MTRTKKILIGLFVFFCVLLVGLYVGGNYLLASYSQQILDAVAKRGKKQGVLITEPQFRSASISGLRSAKWQGLYTELQFPGSEAFDEAKVFELRVGQIDGWLAGGGKITLVARDVDIDINLPRSPDEQLSGSDTTSRERVTAKRLQCDFPMDLGDPMPGLQEALVQITQLIRQGSTTMAVLANGILEFELNEKPVQVGLKVDQASGAEDEGYKLVLSSMDLKAISGNFREPLTEAEVELLANNPLRAAQLLRIKDDAESTAAAANAADDAVPQDAYRHVLWSFLLTNKYGAEFAKAVTDSHEEGDTGNTPAERAMDYNNNKVGRSYAERKIRRANILEEMQADSSVIVAPE